MNSPPTSAAERFARDLASHLGLKARPISYDEMRCQNYAWEIRDDQDNSVARVTYSLEDSRVLIHESSKEHTPKIRKFDTSNYQLGTVILMGSHVPGKMINLRANA